MASRITRNAIEMPKGVSATITDSEVILKGPKGEIKQFLLPYVAVTLEDNALRVTESVKHEKAAAMSGTMGALLKNHIKGALEGYTIELKLVGVGYKVAAGMAGNRHKVDLSLGFSHPVSYLAPEGITFKAKSATELEIFGVHKQLVGQVAADIRAIRPPEPYKGKGVRYANEVIKLKETKKK